MQFVQQTQAEETFIFKLLYSPLVVLHVLYMTLFITIDLRMVLIFCKNQKSAGNFSLLLISSSVTGILANVPL